MGALSSIPLCQRAGALEGEDTNNNLATAEDRNLAVVAQVAEVVQLQPEATSTPKLRRIEPLPEVERDLGESSNSDSLESELEVSRAMVITKLGALISDVASTGEGGRRGS